MAERPQIRPWYIFRAHYTLLFVRIAYHRGSAHPFDDNRSCASRYGPHQRLSIHVIMNSFINADPEDEAPLNPTTYDNSPVATHHVILSSSVQQFTDGICKTNNTLVISTRIINLLLQAVLGHFERICNRNSEDLCFYRFSASGTAYEQLRTY